MGYADRIHEDPMDRFHVGRSHRVRVAALIEGGR
jgi:hypothetical protein